MTPVPVAVAIEAATALVSVALRTQAGVHAVRSDRTAPPAAAPDPMALLDGLLRQAGLPVAALARIVVDVGPGSYTGLRVALAGAKTLARFVPCELVAVQSLEVIAWITARAERLAPGTLLLPLLEARRERLCGGLWQVTAQGIKPLGPPACRTPSAWVQDLPEGTLLCGEARSLLPATDLRVLLPQVPTAEALLELGVGRATVDPATVEPLYLMASAAEEQAGAGP
jgi:tRNA threonylcarbamoyladenosine biosynthesis protein TsaB